MSAQMGAIRVNVKLTNKVSPFEFHSAMRGSLYRLIFDWRKGKGRVYPEWAVTLKRNGVPWVQTPDVTYVSYERLPKSWKRNEAPVPCDLAIEIISLKQTLKEFEDKVKDYFAAGVSRVWVVDPEAMSIRAFYSFMQNER